ncbi:adenylate kinase [soil metagenome]
MKVWVLIGGPGAGKGTQAQMLADRLGLPHVASGDLFRSHIRDDTSIGRRANRYITAGSLVPDEVTVKMIEQRLSEPDAAAGAILDGFPRTRPQAEALAVLLARRGGQVAGALYLDVDSEVLLRRLSGRWLCEASEDHLYHELSLPPRQPGVCDIDGSPLYQRADDQPTTVRARLDKQLPPMFEVVDFYADAGLLSTVDAELPPEEVTEALLRVMTSASAAGR